MDVTEVSYNNVWMRSRPVRTGAIHTRKQFCYGLRNKEADDLYNPAIVLFYQNSDRIRRLLGNGHIWKMFPLFHPLLIHFFCLRHSPSPLVLPFPFPFNMFKSSGTAFSPVAALFYLQCLVTGNTLCNSTRKERVLINQAKENLKYVGMGKKVANKILKLCITFKRGIERWVFRVFSMLCLLLYIEAHRLKGRIPDFECIASVIFTLTVKKCITSWESGKLFRDSQSFV